MLDKQLINKKLEAISLYLKELEPILNLPYKNFYQNYRDLRTAERDFQLIVDAAVDINTYIILELGEKVPETNFQSFAMLEALKILPSRLVKNLSSSAGLRNRLVHEYEKIDSFILYKSLKKFNPLYYCYCREIIKWMK